MTDIKRYHVAGGELLEGTALGRITVVLSADFDAYVSERAAQPVVDGLPEPRSVHHYGTDQFSHLVSAGFNEALFAVTPLVARLQGDNDSIREWAREASAEIDRLQNIESELTRARELLDSIQCGDPDKQFLSYPMHRRITDLLANQSAPADQCIERGLNHGFNQSPNSCRHDHRTGVWWQEGSVTRTGRECDACGSVAEDPIQTVTAAKVDCGNCAFVSGVCVTECESKKIRDARAKP